MVTGGSVPSLPGTTQAADVSEVHEQKQSTSDEVTASNLQHDTQKAAGSDKEPAISTPSSSDEDTVDDTSGDDDEYHPTTTANIPARPAEADHRITRSAARHEHCAPAPAPVGKRHDAKNPSPCHTDISSAEEMEWSTGEAETPKRTTPSVRNKTQERASTQPTTGAASTRVQSASKARIGSEKRTQTEREMFEEIRTTLECPQDGCRAVGMWHVKGACDILCTVCKLRVTRNRYKDLVGKHIDAEKAAGQRSTPPQARNTEKNHR